jgi:hypothetical protein
MQERTEIIENTLKIVQTFTEKALQKYSEDTGKTFKNNQAVIDKISEPIREVILQQVNSKFASYLNSDLSTHVQPLVIKNVYDHLTAHQTH